MLDFDVPRQQDVELLGSLRGRSPGVRYNELGRAAREMDARDSELKLLARYGQNDCVIPMGRKSWLFCWTELGAQHVGIIQSLIVTCRLHGIDPYTYLVDVLQRVAELTPRLWKQHFAAHPLRSDIHEFPT